MIYLCYKRETKFFCAFKIHENLEEKAHFSRQYPLTSQRMLLFWGDVAEREWYSMIKP